jgi:hypothetical protein
MTSPYITKDDDNDMIICKETERLENVLPRARALVVSAFAFRLNALLLSPFHPVFLTTFHYYLLV